MTSAHKVIKSEISSVANKSVDNLILSLVKGGYSTAYLGQNNFWVSKPLPSGSIFDCGDDSSKAKIEAALCKANEELKLLCKSIGAKALDSHGVRIVSYTRNE
jgi:hypothetical protein